jgi:hypothetical protein
MSQAGESSSGLDDNREDRQDRSWSQRYEERGFSTGWPLGAGQDKCGRDDGADSLRTQPNAVWRLPSGLDQRDAALAFGAHPGQQLVEAGPCWGQPAALGRRVHADTGSVVALVGQRGQPEEGGRGVQRAEEAGGAGGGEVMRSPRLHAFKRLRTRYEQRADIHLGLLQLACALSCYRHLLGILKWVVTVRRAEVPHSTDGAAPAASAWAAWSTCASEAGRSISRPFLERKGLLSTRKAVRMASPLAVVTGISSGPGPTSSEFDQVAGMSKLLDGAPGPITSDPVAAGAA